MTEVLGDDFLVNRTAGQSMLVAVKMLRPDADDLARYCTRSFSFCVFVDIVGYQQTQVGYCMLVLLPCCDTPKTLLLSCIRALVITSV